MKNSIDKKDKEKKKRRMGVLIFCLIIVYGVGAIGGIFTLEGVKDPGYDSIKPSITPPNYVFPIVWNILFFLIALSLYFSWIKSDNNLKLKLCCIFGINFILNILWSFFYFKLKNPLFAFIEIIFLLLSIIIMINLTYKIDKKSAYLLIPYLLWVGFAGVLTYLSIKW